MKEDGACLFYNNSWASRLYWFIFRNNTLHLFLVPYPFKIEASFTKFSYFTMYISLHFWHFSVYGLPLLLTRFICTVAELQQGCLQGVDDWAAHQQGLGPLKPAIPKKQTSSSFDTSICLTLQHNVLSSKNAAAPTCFLEGKVVQDFIQLWNWREFNKLERLENFTNPQRSALESCTETEVKTCI